MTGAWGKKREVDSPRFEPELNRLKDF